MYITKTTKKKITSSLEQQPLSQGEFRRLPNMGSHYISLESKGEGAEFLCEIEVGEGKKVYLYKKTE